MWVKKQPAAGGRPAMVRGCAWALRLLADADGVGVQAVAAAARVVEQRVEALLHVAEDLVGVVLGAGAGLALQLAGIGQDGIGLLLGDAHDLLLGGDGHGLGARVFDHAVGLGLGVVEQALALADDLSGLGELARERVADLVHDLEGGGDVHLTQVVLAEHRLRVLQEDGQLLQKPQNSSLVHGHPSSRHVPQGAPGLSHACAAAFAQ